MLETLESRRLLSVSVAPWGTILVSGTAGDDNIQVRTDGDDIVVNDNGTESSFLASHVTAIMIRGFGGNNILGAQVVGTPESDVGIDKPMFIFSADGNDTITGGNRFDIIYSGPGDDQISAGPGWDSVWGGAGNDTLHGGAGNDILDGNLGTDSIDGGDGQDVVSYFGRLTNLHISLNSAGNGATGENDQITAVEHVLGGFGNDTITGDGNDNILVGGPGNDSISGLGGNDTLRGGIGMDTLLGGTGDDRLNGFDGEADSLNGGDGNDTAVTDVLDTVEEVETVL